ncbi:MAG: helix-turn-helix transcriptional regulator [Ignavibacteriaceae bacterium]
MSKTRTRKRLAHNIRAKRIRQRLTQARLADRLGVQVLAVKRWEAGQAAPSPENLDKLSLMLKCDVSAFFLEKKVK